MRRVCLVLVALMFVQLATPRRAEAWFGWLDELSGPGKFYGFQVDMRIKCFGARPKGEEIGVERGADHVLPGIRLSFCPVLDKTGRHNDADRLFSFDIGQRFFWTTDHPSASDPDPRAFADGHPLFLLTTVPAISYRPIYQLVRNLAENDKRRWLDVVDVGAGAGFYWFTSKGIDDFGGFTNEVRLDIHVPSNVDLKVKEHKWLRYLVPQVRITEVAFPGGFDANVFNPVLPTKFASLLFVPNPAKNKSLALKGPDWTPSVVFFVETRIGK